MEDLNFLMPLGIEADTCVCCDVTGAARQLILDSADQLISGPHGRSRFSLLLGQERLLEQHIAVPINQKALANLLNLIYVKIVKD